MRMDLTIIRHDYTWNADVHSSYTYKANLATQIDLPSFHSAGTLSIGPHKKKNQTNYNRSSDIFIHENAPENFVSKMVAILSREMS